ncbi:coiled-coil domain-containing protein 89 [Gastrophryne carolinensis]
MLRSRLDEQSQLICMLKQRADEAALRCQSLEETNDRLEKQRAEAHGLLMAERHKGAQLEERFNLLADNHQQIIRFKDDYKRHNDELRAQCALLREQRHTELLAAERNCQELRAQLEAANTQLSQQGARYREELTTLQLQLDTQAKDLQGKSEEIESLTRRLENSEETCGRVKEELSHLMDVRKTEQKEAEKKAEELNKERQELLLLCMERGRSLQERQKDAAEMANRLQSAEQAWRDAEERFQSAVTEVDADARVVELNSRLRDREMELEQTRKAFDGYKKHSGQLLAKERELNAKLRHLIG